MKTTETEKRGLSLKRIFCSNENVIVYEATYILFMKEFIYFHEPTKKIHTRNKPTSSLLAFFGRKYQRKRHGKRHGNFVSTRLFDISLASCLYISIPIHTNFLNNHKYTYIVCIHTFILIDVQYILSVHNKYTYLKLCRYSDVNILFTKKKTQSCFGETKCTYTHKHRNGRKRRRLFKWLRGIVSICKQIAI